MTDKKKSQLTVSKEFWKYLDTKRLKPETRSELRTIYYEEFRKTLPPSICTTNTAFSSIMCHLKRMKRLTKAKDGKTILYYQRKGRRLVLAVDQGFVQRQKRRAASRASGEKDVDETENEEQQSEPEDSLLLELKKKFVQNK